MTTSPPTWDQVIATKHWHACDLDTHTLTQCSQLARRDDALDWGGTRATNRAAQQDNWPKTVAFLKEAL